MATTKVIDVLNRANKILNDVTKVRWQMQELLDWFNDAQKAVVAQRPDANAVNTVFLCTNNSRQTLPSDGLRLIKVIRNTLAGTAITLIDEQILNEQARDWHNNSVTVTDVKHYIYDDRDPKHFYLFGVPVNTHSIDIVYSTAPVAIIIVNFLTDLQTITLDDVYVNPLIDFILSRAYSKDAEYAADPARSSEHFNKFMAALGNKTEADVAASPNHG